MESQSRDEDMLRQVQERVAQEAAKREMMGERACIQEEGTASQQRRGFHFVSAHSLCLEPKATEWLIKGFLDKHSLSVIFGEPESMKSFLTIDLGLCVATSHTWHGQAVKQAGPVFYIPGEGFAGLSRRIKGWSAHHGIALQGVPFFVSSQAGQFLEKKSADEIIAAADELIKNHGNPSLIIIDTLSRNFGPGDENSTSDMTRFISVIDDALRSRYHTAVLIVHHSGLSASERARGASALRAALDWEYRLQRNADGIRILTCTKSKDYEPPPAIYFKPEIITLDGWIDPEDGETMTSCVLLRTDDVTPDSKPLTGTKKIAYDVLLSINEEYVHIDTWRDAAYSAGISPSSDKDAKRMAFKRAVSDLRNAGIVKTQNDYWWAADDRKIG